jgi:gluconolactonase
MQMTDSHYRISLLLGFFLAGVTAAARSADTTPTRHVPTGTVTRHTFNQSKIFPGTTREYWVYVPAQYDGKRPACVHVEQDGVQFNMPAVFDRLIASGAMPVTIGVFVQPGVVKAPSPAALDRFNRSFEYDGLGDAYARFLLDELLPHIAKDQKLNLSTSGNDRSIGGSSSGAVCAFTAAWERPDAFTRVLSAIGTYVGLRGGNEYPTLIRKTEPKPIRVFLQDGSGDLNIYGGDWWMANQEMERALTFAGYEVNHVWGTDGHNGHDITKHLDEALKFLWKGWPAPVKAGLGSDQLREILIPGEGWKLVEQGVPALEKGDLVKRAGGGVYSTQSVGEDRDSNRVWFLGSGMEKRAVDTGLKCPSGVTLSPDQSLLYVADAKSRWVYSYQVQPDGSLQDKQKYFHLHVPDTADDSGAGAMRADRAGRLYVATRMGIQICDQAGRVNCIIPAPCGQVGNLWFGGEKFDTLFAACGEKVFQRRLKVRGIDPSAPPLKPAAPHL